jgi:tetratricopeptide (TPR) repeat protein
MYHIVALEGATSTYKDSLAITYFNVGNYVSSHLLAKELLVTKPESLQLLEINAASLQNLNATKEAIDAYEVLFAKTKNMAHGYQLAILQFGIKRLAEAQATINQTLLCEPIEKAYVQMAVDKTKNQNVPLQAAAYNLQGLIAFELKDNTAASTAFNEALKIMPEFALATQNANAVLVTMQNERSVQPEAPTNQN